jgi:hypothetical protein
VQLKLNFRTLIEYSLVLIVVSFVFLAFYYPMLQVKGYGPKDDWTAVLIASDTPPHPQLVNVAERYSDFWIYGVKDEINIGRFRPIYWLLYTLESHLFYRNVQLWQLETLLIGVFTVWLFYVVLRQLEFGIVAAFFGSISMLFVAHGRLWAEKQIAEEPAMLLLMIALWLFIKTAKSGNLSPLDWLGLILLCLTGWIKESFILIIPVMVLIRILAQYYFHSSTQLWFDILKSQRWLLIASGLVVLLQLGIVAYVFTRPTGYSQLVVNGTENVSRFSPQAWVSLYIRMQEYILFSLLLLPLFLYFLAHLKQPQVRAYGLAIALVVVLWLLPQFILYANTLPWQPYYYYPGALAVIFLNALAVETLYRKLSRPTFVPIAIGLLIVTVYLYIPLLQYQIIFWSINTDLYDRAVDTIIEQGKAARAVLVVTSDVLVERDLQLMIELTEAGLTPFVTVDDVSGERQLYQGDAYRLIPWEFNPEMVDVILFLASEAEASPYAEDTYSWFEEAEWTIYPIHDEYAILYWIYLFTTDDPWVRRSVEYSVFVRKEDY